MANKQYINNHNNIHPNDGSTFHSIWVCPTYAGRPVTGLAVGDFMWAVDAGALYIADSTTTWTGDLNVDQITLQSLILSAAAGNYHLFVSGASAPHIITIPDTGGTLVEVDFPQILSNKELTTPTIASLTNAQHNHSNAAGGGAIPEASITDGTILARVGSNESITGYWTFVGGVTLPNNTALAAIDSGGTARSIFFVSPSDETIFKVGKPGGSIKFQDSGFNVVMALSDSGPLGCVPALVGSGADPPASSGMGKVNRTGQNASIAAFNLTNGTPAGLYRISYFLRCTTADATAGTISFSTTYTDSVGATTETSATAALTSTANRANGTFTVDLASGNIQGLTTLTGIAGTSQYKLRVRVEYLG